MRGRTGLGLLGAAAGLAGLLVTAGVASAHPMGNFSISRYAAIRVDPDGIRLRYVVDMAEIPTFQAIQESGIVPEAGHPSLAGYLPRTLDALAEGLVLELDGRRLTLRRESGEVVFPPGAGGLPTMKVGAVLRASLDGAVGSAPGRVAYWDVNFPERAGWKEVVAVAGSGITLVESSAPASDRSRELSDYPADLLDSPPQDLTAWMVFVRDPVPAVAAAAQPAPPAGIVPAGPPLARERVGGDTAAAARIEPAPAQAARATSPRSAFTELIATRRLGLGVILLALAGAAGLGALHALEPGHGKTVVAAYLVGSRGTAWHALVLGLIVTASHTAGVYLLGGVTLYASRYVVPERLYPWLGVLSGLAVAGLGLALLLRRAAGAGQAHGPGHAHGAGHVHAPGHDHDHGHHGHHHAPEGAVSPRALLALGITGGIVPCPAALVVLLGAVALRRIGFGLLLIVAFSVGLAAVLVGIGLLMVYARRFMSRFRSEGTLITRWLPLTSAAVITLTGIGIAVQALESAGILTGRL